MRIFITKKEIESKQTPNGGYAREQLEEWGIPCKPWPPLKGWKKRLLREGYEIEARERELDRECDNARDRVGDEA
jgi:hypothetical protein